MLIQPAEYFLLFLRNVPLFMSNFTCSFQKPLNHENLLISRSEKANETGINI